MAYRQVDLVEVRAWDHTVGAVTVDPASGFYAFEYDPAWLRRGIELSPLRMPARPGVFVFPELAPMTFQRLPAMLADSLPDRFGNALVTAKLTEEGIPNDLITPLDRLAYSGTRGMGALEYHPPANSSTERSTALQLADLVVAARNAMEGDFGGDEATHEALMELIQVGTSAGGARAKAIVCFNPTTGQVRSDSVVPPAGYAFWLLKLDGVDGKQLAAPQGFGRIEHAYSRMATAAGIDMEPCRLLEENGRAHFMTRRFDRRDDGSKIHTQTLCGIDHLDFNLPDTHSYGQYLDVVDRLGLGPDAREQAFRRIVFNVAAANRDDHTKNLSFCCDAAGNWSLAPAYDVNYAYNPVGAWTQRHQMSVNGTFEAIQRADLLELADRFTVPAAATVLDEVVDATRSWSEFAAESRVARSDIARIETDLQAFRPR